MADALATAVQTQVAAWKENRKLFPGWLIAPHQIREHLWTFTRFWLSDLVRVLPEFELAERLVVLEQLNWRLETALMPPWPELVSLATACLEGINPFPGEIEIPEAELIRSKENVDRKKPGWNEIRDAWLELAFGVLRFYREERKALEFERWAELLNRLTTSFVADDSRSRFCYERCLYALAQMDDSSVREVLKAWPDTASDSVWDVRKAAIVAELGGLKDAISIAGPRLAKLREGLRHATNPIPELSREGWTMLLLRGLFQAVSYSGGAGDVPDERGRWEQLSRDRCNPWVELDFFNSRFEQSVPIPPPARSRRASFQPETYLQSWSINHTWIDKLLPAYQYMRIVEEGPCPPRCGSVSLSNKPLKTIAEWLIVHDPIRTQSLVCRLLDEQLIERYFSRHRVASLSADSAESFVEIAQRAIEQSLPDSISRRDAESSAFVDRAHERLRAGIELLSRVVVRVSPDACSYMCTQAIRLYSSPTVRNSVVLPRSVANLITNLITCFPLEELEKRLFDLISLPIPGSSSFPVHRPDGWVEFWPELLDRLCEIEGRLHPSTGQWQSEIFWKQQEAPMREFGDGPSCVFSCSIGPDISNPRRQRSWPKSTGDKGMATELPAVWGVSRSECLSLPEPHSGIAVRRFREYAHHLEASSARWRSGGS